MKFYDSPLFSCLLLGEQSTGAERPLLRALRLDSFQNEGLWIDRHIKRTPFQRKEVDFAGAFMYNAHYIIVAVRCCENRRCGEE